MHAFKKGLEPLQPPWPGFHFEKLLTNQPCQPQQSSLKHAWEAGPAQQKIKQTINQSINHQRDQPAHNQWHMVAANNSHYGCEKPEF